METKAYQIRRYIIRPTLRQIGLWSQEAEELLIGTAAHESNGFRAIHQYSDGPALSMYQIEPATHDDLWKNSFPGLSRTIPDAITAVKEMVAKRYAVQPPAEYLLEHVWYATAICRLLYYRVPSAIPITLEGWAAYYKKYFNTPAGKATEQDFIDAYKKYCTE